MSRQQHQLQRGQRLLCVNKIGLIFLIILTSCQEKSVELDYRIVEKSINLVYLDLTETNCLHERDNTFCPKCKKTICNSFVISDSLEINRINLKRLDIEDDIENNIHRRKYFIDKDFLSLIIEPEWFTVSRLEDYQSDIIGLCKVNISVPIIIKNRAYSEVSWSYTESYNRAILIFERDESDSPWYLISKEFRR